MLLCITTSGLCVEAGYLAAAEPRESNGCRTFDRIHRLTWNGHEEIERRPPELRFFKFSATSPIDLSQSLRANQNQAARTHLHKSLSKGIEWPVSM